MESLTTLDEEDTSLDFYGRFHNPSLQIAYVRSCLKQKSSFSFIFVVSIIAAWAISETVATLFVYSNELELSISVAVVSFLLIALCLFLSIWIFCLFKKDDNNSFFYHSYCQLGLIICINLLFLLKIIAEGLFNRKECYSENIYIYDDSMIDIKMTNSSHTVLQIDYYTDCPSSNSFLSIVSLSTTMVLSFSPFFLSIVLYEPRLYIFVIAEVFLGGAIISVSYSTAIATAPIIILLIMLAVLSVEVHFQRVKAFLSNRKLQEILAENERNADANHAMEMRHMIGNVAHDLKTPLSSFTSGIDLIKDILTTANNKLGSKQQNEKAKFDEFKETFSSIDTCLTNIRNTNAFMLMTINRCIDYTKASKGMKLVPKYETVDLREALQFPIECMSHIQERIGIKLEAMSGDICSHIITDKQWLQENLLCLLSNAVKYSTEGSVTIKGKLTTMVKDWDEENQKEVSLFQLQKSSAKLSKVIPTTVDEEESERSQFLLFEIEDTGIGVSGEAMKNLFNPFKQAQRLAGGTGLGLYSLAKRMESLKGRYGARRRRDGEQGSLFWFAIPYKPDPISDNHKRTSLKHCTCINDLSSESSKTRSSDSYKMQPLEILIVDDAPSILKISSMMLKRQGHQIWTAENGEIALKRIEEKWRGSGKGFDLVLMDLQMPVMDGLEATRRLRGMESEGREWMDLSVLRCKIKQQIVFGVSANSDDETIEEAFAAGVNEFMGKPF